MAEKIKVVICAGTSCYVMGAPDILLLEDNLPESLRDRVDIEGANCLGLCRKTGAGKAPFVTVNGELISGATLPIVVRKVLEAANAQP